jgi:hypothetical protein
MDILNPYTAIRNGNLTRLKLLLMMPLKLTPTITDLFKLSAECGHLDIVKYFIEEKKVDVFAQYGAIEQAVERAIGNNKMEIVNYLIEQKIILLKHSISHCVREDSLDGIKYLHDKNYFSQEIINEIFRQSTIRGRMHIIQYLVENGYSSSDCYSAAIIHAAHYNELDILKYFVNLGGDFRASNDRALVASASEGHLETTKYLFSLGCGPLKLDARLNICFFEFRSILVFDNKLRKKIQIRNP